MTTYTSNGNTYSRYFHSKESIKYYLSDAGFLVNHIDAYHEQLYVDFQRTQPSKILNSLIEILGIK